MSLQQRRRGARNGATGGGGGAASGPLAIIGTALAVAGLGYYVYKLSIGSGGGSGTGGNSRSGAEGGHGTASGAAARGGGSSSNHATSSSSHQPFGKASSPRPSLSLSLPPNFRRDDASSLSALRTLLTHLSPHFVVHLISPPRLALHTQSSTASSSGATAEASAAEVAASLAELTESLSGIPQYDERRTLEYSRESGRQALSRALACDAHCEVLIPHPSGSGSGRAGAGAGVSAKAVQAGATAAAAAAAAAAEDPEEAAQRYASDLSRLKKGTGLLILLALPSLSPPSSTAAGTTTTTTTTTTGQIDVARALEPFRTRPGHPPVPGVRLFDLTTDAAAASAQGSQEAEEAWDKAGRLVAEVRKGWR